MDSTDIVHTIRQNHIAYNHAYTIFGSNMNEGMAQYAIAGIAMRYF